MSTEGIEVMLDEWGSQFALIEQQRFHVQTKRQLDDPRRISLSRNEAEKVYRQLGKILGAIPGTTERQLR